MTITEILSLNAARLRTKLVQLGLSDAGTRSVLQETLIRHFGYTNGSSNPQANAEAASGFNGDLVRSMARFTVKDVEDSLSKFSGEGTLDIDNWIQEFEDCANIVNWNDLEKYVFSRQLLTGAARSYVKSQTDVKDWSTLKAKLKGEFGKKVSSIAIHKKLRNRKKRSDETFRQYLYALMEIGSAINLDDTSLIEYFVEGIPDAKSNKVILYKSKTINELKENMDVYEKIFNFEKSSNFKGAKPKTEKPFTKSEVTIKCFKCGESGHIAKDCTSKDLKCFKCGKAGHKSVECGKSVKKEEKPRTDNKMVHTLFDEVPASRRIFKEITIFEKTISAMIDTGSDISIIRYDTLLNLTDVVMDPCRKTLTGIGGKSITTLGKMKIRVKLDTVTIDITFYVVQECDVLYSAIIGNDVLSTLDLIIDKNGARFRQKFAEVNIFENESLNFNEEVIDYQPVLKANPISELQSEFENITHSVTDVKTPSDELELEHLPKHFRENVEYAVESYSSSKPSNFPIKMKIILTDDIPVCSSPRRMSYSDQKFIEDQVKAWLDDGIVKASFSEYSSPVVLVSKKDGTKRLCCDYRRLNEKIVRDNFPMALMDDVLQRLQEAKVYTTLDLKNGFFHVPVEEESKKYTAFVTHNGQFEFQFVPFGITNSPAVFCRFIAVIFHDLIRDGTIIVYMDDIVIPSVDEAEGLAKLNKVFEVASLNGLNIKWSKCQFLMRRINFLGYVIENSTISPSTEKISAVKNFSAPRTVKAVQRFLGLTSYFRRFIPDYAMIAKPLSDLLRKNAKFKMGDEEEIAFQQLKNCLSGDSVLRLYNPKAITEIHADASKYGYGAVLLQKDSEDRQLHPVEYMSRKTTPAEENYHSYELEVLAIVEALKKWRIYVMGIKFKIITDCNAFAMTMRKKDVPVRVSRWALFLQEYDYIIEHRSGSKMRHVDALSRVSCLMIQDTLQHKIKEAQRNDEWTKAIRKVLEKDSFEDFYIKYDILHKDPTKELIVIPSDMQKEIIEIAHRQGHFATKRTRDIVEKNFYIPKIESKAEAVVKSCVECIITNSKTGRKEGVLDPIDKSNQPLKTYHLDHVGPMESTKKQYNHILVVIDGFSKFVWLYPTKSTGSNEVVEKLSKQASTFGNPERIITDRGSAFTSGQFKEYCVNENIQHLLIATGVPRGNGQVERIHRIIVPILAKMCAENPTHWYKHVDRVQQILNNTPTRSTKNTPFKIMTGMNMRTNDDPDIRRLLEELSIDELQQQREEIREDARENIHKIQEENKRNFDKKRVTGPNYKAGDIVAIKRTQFGTGMKLRPKFIGPYKITAKLNHGRFEVEKLGEGEGTKKCTTVLEYMKPWNHASGSNHVSGGPDVGLGHDRL